jgi:hypothetical protein
MSCCKVVRSFLYKVSLTSTPAAATIPIEASWTTNGLFLLFPFGSSPTRLIVVNVTSATISLSIDGQPQGETIHQKLKEVLDISGSPVVLVRWLERWLGQICK